MGLPENLHEGSEEGRRQALLVLGWQQQRGH
jgi:hypothetical protein